MKIRVSALVSACALAYPFVPAQADDTQLGHVVVTATRQQAERAELTSDVSIIDRRDIEAAGSMTLGEMLARQPGIQFSQAGGAGKASGLYVRGTDSGHVLVLIDGVRTGSATLGEPSIQNIPLEQIDRIEILRGPASALYGSDAIGGVIQIFTREASHDGVRPRLAFGVGSDDLRKLAVGLSGSSNKWSYVLDAGYSDENGFSVRKAPDGDSDNDGYRNSHAAGRLVFKPVVGHELGGSFFYSKGRSWIDNAYDSTPADLFSDTELSTFALFSKNKVSEFWNSTVQISTSIDRSADTFSLWEPTSHYRTQQDQFSWTNDLSMGVGRLLLGYEYLDQSIKTDKNYDLTSRDVHSALVGWSGNYGAQSIQVNLRHDDSSVYGQKRTGALGYGYQLNSTLRVIASYGTSFKAPTFNDMYWPYSESGPFGGVTYVTQGNTDVEPEEGRNREFALIWDDGHNSASITYYLNKVKNLIDWQKSTPDSSTVVYQPSNVGRARLEGVTLQAASYWREWKATAVVDLLKARDEDTGEHLQRRAPRKLNLTVEHRGGFATVGAQFDAVARRYSESGNMAPLSGYATMDLYARKALDKDWSIEARVNNVFDRDYELIQGYDTSGANVFVGMRYEPR